MFMTQMRLNPARQGTRRLVESPQRMHAAVALGFPGLNRERVLWRLDARQAHDLRLLVVSPRQPDLTHLVEQAGWPTLPDATWVTKEYTPFLDRLQADQWWAFRLRANPVVRKRNASGRIQTFAHVTAEQQREWLVERTESIGVEFSRNQNDRVSVEVRQRDSQTFQRRSASPQAGRRVTVVSADLEGLLRVKDADVLRRALIGGVGRAKAYGCGLLTLARPS